MSTRLPVSSTVRAVLLSVAVLAVLVAFIATSKNGDEGEANGLPEGFSAIPEDVFLDRVIGAQRAAGSWHLEQQKVVGGIIGTELSSDRMVGAGGEAHQSELNLCCQSDGSKLAIKVTVVDGTFYAFGLGSEKPWWRIDTATSATNAEFAERLGELVTQDTSPRLQEGASDFELVGADSVGGVTAAHYAMTLSPPDSRPSPDATASPSPLGDNQVRLDVWVDEEDRPLKIVTTLGSGPNEVVTTTTYTDYGEDFDITAPPADQVTDQTPDASQTAPPTP